MGGLFGGGGGPSGPSQAELDAQAERERRAEASRQISRSRRNRMLMSGDATGVEPVQRTLGPGRNPRA